MRIECFITHLRIFLSFSEVTVEYYRGLPQVTVPLPSRKERCRFTLRPISNTVGDFLTMIQEEDRGIDRVAVKTVGECVAVSDLPNYHFSRCGCDLSLSSILVLYFTSTPQHLIRSISSVLSKAAGPPIQV